ncbi:MAG: S41 family peptidase [Kangiellaceae bacterium]|nr:S41 family peptidase [Kangiellaceae bacterium]
MSRVLPTILLVLFTWGCGDSEQPGVAQGAIVPPTLCTADTEKQFVFAVMNDTYLYYNQVPSVNLDEYETAESLLEDLRVSPDRFSYITSAEANENFFEEGTYIGFGFNSSPLPSEQAYVINFVYDNSAVGQAGIIRSDRILAVDGVSSQELIDTIGLSEQLASINEGESATFTIQSIGAEPRDVILTKGLVTMNTVLKAEVVENQGRSIGYVAVSNFIENTSPDFTEVATTFNNASIDELVLDLRYNGGGRVSAALTVASLIGGASTNGNNFAKYIHNDKYIADNRSILFSELSDAMNLSRVYVLTTDSTCSASELVMNSLSPFADVIRIGGTTCGKPIGFYGKTFCEKLIQPIELEIRNHFDEGGYFDGLTPTCEQEDIVSTDFANVQDAMFAHAIYHMDNAACDPSTSTASEKKSRFIKTLAPTDPLKTNH